MPHRFTVVIPTRERADTLEKTLRTVTAQDYDKLEIIVSDNLSADQTRDVVESARDPRIRYLSTGRRLSMSENWEFALSHVTGDWVTVVGDDDGLLRECLSKIDALATETGAHAISSSMCSFLWPALTGGCRSGILSVPVREGWERRRTAEWRARVLAGRSTYPMLPMLYTGGFVSTGALQAARLADGRFYRSCIPDVYSTMVLSRILPEYVHCWEPVTISGLSRHSTGYSQFSQPSRQSDTRASDMFRREGNIPFHPDLPVYADGQYPRSIQVMVYESYLQVADLLPEPHPLSRIHQLTVILATAGEHAAAIREWGQRFASMHGLDFAAAEAAARRYKFRLAARTLPETAALMFRIHTIGSDALPLLDVYDASLAASVVLAVKPSRLVHVAGKIRARLAGRRRPVPGAPESTR